MSVKKTREQFIEDAIRLNGDRYDYSLVEYEGSKINVKIICRIHGTFTQRPNNHLNGQHCPECSLLLNIETNRNKFTVDDFIKKSNIKHNNRYDYSQITEVLSLVKVHIICREHGVFYQKPHNHMSGQNCPSCIKEKRIPRKKSKIHIIDDFKLRSFNVHGNRYDYSLSNFIDNNTPVTIICKEHGHFNQSPYNHIYKRCHCPKCANIERGLKSRSNRDKFISISTKIHNNQYDYSLVEYSTNKNKVKIVCKQHGVFEQRPDSHIQGLGCMYCFGTFKKSNSKFIEESIKKHGKKYDYSLVDYKNRKDKITIICKEHGEFKQSPSTHINGTGCPKCAINSKMDKEDFIKKSMVYHRDTYDYSKSNFTNVTTKVEIVCKKHGSFYQMPYKHIQKRGCPKCKMSKGIYEIAKILEDNNIEYEYEVSIDGCVSINNRPLKFDILLTKTNTYIEYDGQQHYIPVKNWGGMKGLESIISRDIIKDKFCEKNNIQLFRISYMDNIQEKMDDLFKVIHFFLYG